MWYFWYSIVKILHGNESLRNYYLSSFGVASKNIYHDLEKLWKYTSLLPLDICGRLDFLRMLQPKQLVATSWMLKHVWESSCLLLSQTLNRFTNMYNYHFSHSFSFILENIVNFYRNMFKCGGFIPIIFKWIKMNTFLSFNFKYSEHW